MRSGRLTSRISTVVNVTSVFSSTSGPTVDCRLTACELFAITTAGTKSAAHHVSFLPGPPSATTGEATAITPNGATLGGTVNPKAGATTVRFEYSTSLTLTGSTPTPAVPVGSGTSDLPVSAGAPGLAPATTYYFRVAAGSSGGFAFGAIKAFTTPAASGLSASGNAPGAIDTTAPGVAGYWLSRGTFVVGGSATPTQGQAAAKKHKKGTTFAYTLSEAAVVRIVITQRRPGRRKGTRCVAPTRKLAKAKRCTRIVVQGTLTRTSRQGANAVAFSGRIGSRALAPGRYQATLIAVDAAANSSAPKTISLTIVKR